MKDDQMTLIEVKTFEGGELSVRITVKQFIRDWVKVNQGAQQLLLDPPTTTFTDCLAQECVRLDLWKALIVLETESVSWRPKFVYSLQPIGLYAGEEIPKSVRLFPAVPLCNFTLLQAGHKDKAGHKENPDTIKVSDDVKISLSAPSRPVKDKVDLSNPSFIDVPYWWAQRTDNEALANVEYIGATLQGRKVRVLRPLRVIKKHEVMLTLAPPREKRDAMQHAVPVQEKKEEKEETAEKKTVKRAATAAVEKVVPQAKKQRK